MLQVVFKQMRSSILLFCALVLIGCGGDEGEPMKLTPAPTTMYFPSDSGSEWETVSPLQLGWNESAIEPLKSFLVENNTKSFVLLVNGRIVIEEYFAGHSASTTWQWNSAGKTLVTSMIGIAQQNELISIDDKASAYLGTEWTNMPLEKETLIQVNHLLTMTSGIDDVRQLVIRENLTYVSDAGSRWAYGNVFQKLIDIVDVSSNESFEDYFDAQLASQIGMNGFWNVGLIYTIYHSTARDMARFGLLALNQGQWNDTPVIKLDFFEESITATQELNPSYGYMWWLNGKTAYRVPGSQEVFAGSLVPNAPEDMYAAMGANEQRIYVVPSKDLVIVRQGDAANPAISTFAVSGFDNQLWEQLNQLFN